MSANVQGTGRSAAMERASLQAKRDSINTTLSAVRGRVGLPSQLLEQVFELQQDSQALWAKVEARWTELHEGQQRMLQRRSALQNEINGGVTSQRHVELLEQIASVQAELERVEQRKQAPDAQLTTLQLEADALMDRASRLAKESGAAATLEAKGAEVFEVERREFGAGRDFHRGQASSMLVWVGVVALAIVGVVAEGLWRASDMKDWHVMALAFGWRFVLLVLGGSLITFLGRLYSQHSQQAVSYQDRLAGIDAAALVLHYGADSASRENLLNRFVETYISGEGNAFRPRTEAQSKTQSKTDGVAEAVKAVEPIVKAIEPLAKALRPGSS